MRLEVINEILLSERYYVRDLELIVYMFIKHLRAFGVLPAEQIEALFINVELILKVNSEILSNLMMEFEAADSDLQRMNIGQVFVRMVEYLKIYSIYSSNHGKSIQTYEQLKRENKQFQAFISEMEAKPESQGCNLLSFLIKPVQRICKYPLLFNQLLLHTPKDHMDYENIETCLKRVQAVAEYVNEKQREFEKLRKMLEIQESIVDLPWSSFSLVEPSRHFVKEGQLEKVNPRGKVQERMFFLFNDILLYCKPLFFKKTSYQYRGHLPLTLCTVSDLPDNPDKGIIHGFQLTRSDKEKKKYTMLAHSDQEKRQWLAKLCEMVQKSQTNEKKKQAALKVY